MTPQERKLWVRQMGARSDWWDLRREAVIEPGREVVDAHFHLWDEFAFADPQEPDRQVQSSRYLLEEFLRDAGGGHAMRQAVYMECGSGYFSEGPEHMRPVGETRFARKAGEALDASASGTRIGAIVAHADLRHPELGAILDAHEVQSGGKLRGIRHIAACMEEPSARLFAGGAPAGLYLDDDYRRGAAMLGERGLACDAFQFHFQLDELAEFARAVPDTTIVVNHLGGPVGYAHLPAERDPVFAAWSQSIEKLAELPNLCMKLGGMASPVTQYDGQTRDLPPSSEEFVEERGAYFHHAIACFGAGRCMFESNFPVDSVAIGYTSLWNAYKRIAMAYDEEARSALLAGTARRVYRLQEGS